MNMYKTRTMKAKSAFDFTVQRGELGQRAFDFGSNTRRDSKTTAVNRWPPLTRLRLRTKSKSKGLYPRISDKTSAWASVRKPCLTNRRGEISGITPGKG